MYALNRAQFIGHLTEDPQIRQTPSGQNVGDLNLVTVQQFMDASGNKREVKAFHSIVVWRGLADIAQRFLKKGSQVYVSARAQTDEWQDPQTGAKRNKTRFTADDMILLDPRNPHPDLPGDSIFKGALNKAEIIGNITRDPELRTTATGVSVAGFGVATNFAWKNREGQIQEKTEFHNVVLWEKLAQQASQTLKKGRKIYVEGRWQTRSWETPDGQKRYTTEIVAQKVLALGTVNPEIGAPMAGAAASGIPAGSPAQAPIPAASSNQAPSQAASANPFASPNASSAPTTGASNPFAASGSTSPAASGPDNSGGVPPVNYNKSEIKPEDLPF